MPEHSDLTGADLHENKGVASAANNTVATASSGATVWQKVTSSMVDTSSIFNTNKAYLTTTITDISTASSIYVYVPFAGTLTKVGTVLRGTIATADSTITVKNHAGSSAGTITVTASGSSAGDIDELSPVSNNTFTNGQRLLIETDGASSNTVALDITLIFTITG